MAIVNNVTMTSLYINYVEIAKILTILAILSIFIDIAIAIDIE